MISTDLQAKKQLQKQNENRDGYRAIKKRQWFHIVSNLKGDGDSRSKKYKLDLLGLSEIQKKGKEKMENGCPLRSPGINKGEWDKNKE